MSEDKKPNAKELIEQIGVLESAEEIDAFLPESEERTTVLEAAEARKAELAASADESEEEAQTSEEDAGSKEESENSENGNAGDSENDGDDDDITEETKVEVNEDALGELVSAIEEVLAGEKALRAVNNKPTPTEAALVEASAVFEDVENVTVEKVKALDKAIIEHLQYDEQRRGLSQPSKAMKALINSYEKLQELEEDEQ